MKLFDSAKLYHCFSTGILILFLNTFFAPSPNKFDLKNVRTIQKVARRTWANTD